MLFNVVFRCYLKIIRDRFQHAGLEICANWNGQWSPIPYPSEETIVTTISKPVDPSFVDDSSFVIADPGPRRLLHKTQGKRCPTYPDASTRKVQADGRNGRVAKTQGIP